MSAPPFPNLKPPNRPAQTFQLDKTSLPGCPVTLGETRLLSSGLKVLVKYAFFPALSKFWPFGLLPKTRRLHFTARCLRISIASPAPISMFGGKLKCRPERAVPSLADYVVLCPARDSGCKPDLVRGAPPGNLCQSMLRNNRALPAAKPEGSGRRYVPLPLPASRCWANGPSGVYRLAPHANRSGVSAENKGATDAAISGASQPEVPCAGKLLALAAPPFAPGNCCTRCTHFARFCHKTSACPICQCGKCSGRDIPLSPSSLPWATGGSPPSVSSAGCFPVPHSFGGNPLAPIPSAFLTASEICRGTSRSACGRALSFACASASATCHPAHCSLRRLPGSAGGRGISSPSPTCEVRRSCRASLLRPLPFCTAAVPFARPNGTSNYTPARGCAALGRLNREAA